MNREQVDAAFASGRSFERRKISAELSEILAEDAVQSQLAGWRLMAIFATLIAVLLLGALVGNSGAVQAAMQAQPIGGELAP